MKKVLGVCLGICVLAGCASSNVVSEDFVKQRSASDMECAQEEIELEQHDNTEWTARGCEQEISYTCWTSVGMGDGTCQRK